MTARPIQPPEPIQPRLPWEAASTAGTTDPTSRKTHARPTRQAVALLVIGAAVAATLAALNRPPAAAAVAVLLVVAFLAGLWWPAPATVTPAADLVDVGEPVALVGVKGTILPLSRGVHRTARARIQISPLGLTWTVTRTVALSPPVFASPLPVPTWAPSAAPDGALAPWAPGEPVRGLAMAASARAGGLVVRGRASADAHVPSIDVHLDSEQDAGGWLSVILEDLRAGTVTVRTLRGGAVVTERIGSRHAARRTMAAAEVGPWPI